MAARQLELDSTADRKRRVEDELTARKASAAEARHALDQLATEASRLKARKDSLEEILSHRAYTTESVKRLFTAIERGQAEGFRPAGVLADFVEVEPAYEKAAEDFLHEELEYVVVQNWNEAERGIDIMRTDLDGRATFLVHPEAGRAAIRLPRSWRAADGMIGRLGDHLRFTNGFATAPPDLLPRLAHCFLARDRAAAQQLAVQHPDFFFLVADGVSYHGHAVSGGKKTGSGPLALKRELRELTGEVQAKQLAVDETAARLDQLEREIAVLSEDLEALRGLQQKQEKEALALDHEHRKLAEEFARASFATVGGAAGTGTACGRKATAPACSRSAISSCWTKKKPPAPSKNKCWNNRGPISKNCRLHAHQLAEEHAALRADLAGFEERRRSERAAQARFETQIQEIVARRGEITAELERLGVERARLLADNIELDRRAGALVEELRLAEEAVARLAEQETTLRGNLAALEETLKQLRAGSASCAGEARRRSNWSW